MPEEELTCDLWGRKPKQAYRRYVLSSRRSGYEILKSFGLQMKPAELNIYENVPGQGIFLYDTQKPTGKVEDEKETRIRLLEYGYGVLNGSDLLNWSLDRITKKLKHKMRRRR